MKNAGIVRPFLERDIPQVTDVHRRVFRVAAAPSAQLERAYHTYLSGFASDNSRAHRDLHSLVYEDARGAIVGFLSVRPQPMWMTDRIVLAAVSSQFIVEEGHRSTLAGLHLLKAFLSGPQELSVVDEANEGSRTLWHGFGGSTAFLQSISWARILLPAQFLLSRLVNGPITAIVKGAATPFGRVADKILGAIHGNPFAPVRPVGAAENPPLDVLRDCMTDISRRWSLRPAYDDGSFGQLISTLEARQEPGPLRKGIVRDSRNRITGWYLYHAKRGGLGEVLQIGAESHSHGQVLDHLFFDARRQGVAALSGRLQPDFMDEFRKKHCLLHHRGYWTLIHSRNPEALEAIYRGDAFLTRLEGEWSMRFEMPGPNSPTGSRGSE
jgi:hypothetical protein